MNTIVPVMTFQPAFSLGPFSGLDCEEYGGPYFGAVWLPNDLSFTGHCPCRQQEPTALADNVTILVSLV